MTDHKGIIIAAIAGISVVAIGLITYISTSNQEVRLRNQVEAQQQVLESHHDRMWKILQQKADVSQEYKKTFEDIYPELIEGRYKGEGGARMMLAKLVKEDNPDFDTSLYKELSRSIEAERVSFHQAQRKLVDVHREHKNLIQTFPGSVMLPGKEPVDITIITSTRSKKAVETGVDDDVSLF